MLAMPTGLRFAEPLKMTSTIESPRKRFRGRFAEHPANRVDDVGLAATVWSDDSHQVAREFDRGRIDERLEARKLDLTQAQWLTP